MVDIPRLHGRTPLQNYLCLKVFHNESDYGNSVFNTTYNFNGGMFGSGFGGGFWNGIGMGLGAGLMNLFGFGGGCGFGNWGGLGNFGCFGGGFGNFGFGNFGNFGFGGFPSISNWWGGSNNNTTTTTGGSTTTNVGGNTYNTYTRAEVPENNKQDNKALNKYKNRYDKLCNEKNWKNNTKATAELRKLYQELIGWSPANEVEEDNDNQRKDSMLKGLREIANKHKIDISDIDSKAQKQKVKTPQADESAQSKTPEGKTAPTATQPVTTTPETKTAFVDDTDPYAGCENISALIAMLGDKNIDVLGNNKQKFINAFNAQLVLMNNSNAKEEIENFIAQIEIINEDPSNAERIGNELAKALENTSNALKTKLKAFDGQGTVKVDDNTKKEPVSPAPVEKDYSELRTDQVSAEDLDKITDPGVAEDILDNSNRTITDNDDKYVKVPRNYTELVLAKKSQLKIKFCQNTALTGKEGKSDTIQGTIINNTIEDNGNNIYTIEVQDECGRYKLELNFNPTDEYPNGHIILKEGKNAGVNYNGQKTDLNRVNIGTTYEIPKDDDAVYATRFNKKPAIEV